MQPRLSRRGVLASRRIASLMWQRVRAGGGRSRLSPAAQLRVRTRYWGSTQPEACAVRAATSLVPPFGVCCHTGARRMGCRRLEHGEQLGGLPSPRPGWSSNQIRVGIAGQEGQAQDGGGPQACGNDKYFGRI